MNLDHTKHVMYVQDHAPSGYPMDDEDQLPLPEEGDFTAILAEMEARQAISDAIKWSWAKDRALSLVAQALRAQPEPSTIEGWLVRVALSHCLEENAEIPSFGASTAQRKVDEVFENLARGWMVWVTSKQEEPLRQALRDLPSEDTRDLESLTLFYWGRALQNLLEKDIEEAKRYFDRAMEVGSQFGTPSNPAICWTYCASFLRGS